MSLLAQEFRLQASKSKDARMKEEATSPVGYSTGFLLFDFKNGTMVHGMKDNQPIEYHSIGIRDGSLVMIIGRSGCGKTTWTLQTAGNIIRPFKSGMIFHDDIEGGIIEERKQQLTKLYGEEFTERYVGRDAGITAENFYERVKMIHDIKLNNIDKFSYNTGIYDLHGEPVYKLEPTVYILDSLALLMPDKYATEDDLSGQMSATAAAKTNAAIFKRLIPMIKAANIILLVINHINQNVSINPMMKKKASVAYLKQEETLPGGNACIYLANNLIRFDDHSKLKKGEGFDIDGIMVDVQLVKSRSNKAGQFARLVFDQDHGFDEELSLFNFLKECKRVKGAGAYLYLGDRDDIKFSQKQFKKKLRENPELREVFMQEVAEELKTMISDNRLELEESDFTTNLSGDILSLV